MKPVAISLVSTACGLAASTWSDMKTIAILLVSSIFVMTALAWPQASGAQVPLIFQTTFDDTSCPTRRAPGEHWRQSDYFGQQPGVDPCTTTDGIRPSGAWTANGFEDRIIAEANYPGGAGGKGFRHWLADGLNDVGGGITLSFSPVSDLYIRYYIKYPAGFAWSGSANHKEIYVQVGLANGFYFGLHSGVIGGSNGTESWHSSVNWAASQGGSSVGDGQWHCREIHVKMQTGSNFDGVFEIWYDGVQVYSNTATRFQSSGTQPGTWQGFILGENANAPNNGGVVAVDFDDIAISATGRIGCIGSTGLPPPNNLRVQ